MWRRWQCWRRREEINAERGSGNAEHTGTLRSASDLSRLFRVPRSDFRVGEGRGVKYVVTIGSQHVEVEVVGSRVLVGGKALEASLAAVPGTPLRHLLVGGESWTLAADRSEEHTSELQSPCNLVCRLLLEKKKKKNQPRLI